ncbi:MAG: hypothetical protein VZQ61_04720 [Christensenellaceae bacterium]
MDKLKPLISGDNLDAIFINGKYQDETKLLELNSTDIKYYQFKISIITNDNIHIELHFHNFKDLCDFVKAYELK